MSRIDQCQTLCHCINSRMMINISRHIGICACCKGIMDHAFTGTGTDSDPYHFSVQISIYFDIVLYNIR